MSNYTKTAILFVVLLAVAAATVWAGQILKDQDEYNDKVWVNKLLRANVTLNMAEAIVKLPETPATYNDETGVVTYSKQFFWRQNGNRGEPLVGILFNVTDSSALTANVLVDDRPRPESTQVTTEVVDPKQKE